MEILLGMNESLGPCFGAGLLFAQHSGNPRRLGFPQATRPSAELPLGSMRLHGALSIRCEVMPNRIPLKPDSVR